MSFIVFPGLQFNQAEYVYEFFFYRLCAYDYAALSICQKYLIFAIRKTFSKYILNLIAIFDRNLVNDTNVQKSLVSLGGVPQISRCLKLFITDLDVVCNIARTVSVMSSDDLACAAIAEDQHFTTTALQVGFCNEF